MPDTRVSVPWVFIADNDNDNDNENENKPGPIGRTRHFGRPRMSARIADRIRRRAADQNGTIDGRLTFNA